MTSGVFSCCCLLGLLLLAKAPQVVHAQGDQPPLEILMCNPWRRNTNDDRMYQGTWLPIIGPNNSKGQAVLRDFQWAVQVSLVYCFIFGLHIAASRQLSFPVLGPNLELASASES